ncbi:hypothetical protein [Mycobacteroides sp. LB1]
MSPGHAVPRIQISGAADDQHGVAFHQSVPSGSEFRRPKSLMR